MRIVQYLQVVLFVFNLTLSTEAQKKVTCQNFKFAIDDDVIHNQIREVTCLKDLQSQTPSSVTWSAKMTACVYPWTISFFPKKTIVS